MIQKAVAEEIRDANPEEDPFDEQDLFDCISDTLKAKGWRIMILQL